MKSLGLLYDSFSLNSLRLATFEQLGERSEGIGCNWLLAPINPSDINQIQGKYPVHSISNVAGNEGVAQVLWNAIANEKMSRNTASLKEGDWVIPAKSGLGTWCTHSQYSNPDTFIKIPKDIPLEVAACLTVNPPTAYRLLVDFYFERGVVRREGNSRWLIQNASTSMVGQCILQLCKEWQIPNIAVVRRQATERQDEILAMELKELGATIVVRECDLSSLKQKPSVAFNAVGGAVVGRMVEIMDGGAVVVTYGGMSKKPFSVSTGSCIFQDAKFVGFWMTRWYKEHSLEERMGMLDEIIQLVRDGKLKLRTEIVPFSVESVLSYAENGTVKETTNCSSRKDLSLASWSGLKVKPVMKIS